MKRQRLVLVLTATASASLGLVTACRTQRGGEAIPLDRRVFHETPPPEMTFANRPDGGDAGEADAAPARPAHRPAHKADGGGAWAAPPSGYLEQLGGEFRRLRPVPLTEYEA